MGASEAHGSGCWMLVYVWGGSDSEDLCFPVGLPADYWGKAARVHYWWTHGEASQLVLYKIAQLVLLV